MKFRPNVLVDGEPMLREGAGAHAYYTDAFTWFHGGRPLFEAERVQFGRDVVELTKEQTDELEVAA